MPLQPQRFEAIRFTPDDRFLSPLGRSIHGYPAEMAGRAIEPRDLLEAVAAMDDSQRGELAELLGVERRHRTLYLPRPGGGFARPLIHLAIADRSR